MLKSFSVEVEGADGSVADYPITTDTKENACRIARVWFAKDTNGEPVVWINAFENEEEN